MAELDLERLSLTELIQLHTRLAEAMSRRFQRPLALLFSDVVDSTPYFQRFGDVAGRSLMQRHVDGLQAALGATGGRLVDTAGDGAFLCFPGVEGAVEAASAALLAFEEQNDGFPDEHRLTVRMGVHHGAVLSDEALVSGDAVNQCARIAAAARPGELWLSDEAFHELPGMRRVRCARQGAVALKGLAAPVQLHAYAWRVRRPVPSLVRVRETGAVFPLPRKDVIRFGRAGGPGTDPGEEGGNDIVLQLDDAEATSKISRWHFELRRRPSGMLLRSVSDRPTTVDGAAVPRGAEVRVHAGVTVRVSDVLSLELTGDERLSGLGAAALTETRQG